MAQKKSVRGFWMILVLPKREPSHRQHAKQAPVVAVRQFRMDDLRSGLNYNVGPPNGT